jgi:hypothetical protein
MSQRRYFVRRFVNNCDRAVALPNTAGPPSPRRGDYDDYQRPRATPEPTKPTVDDRYIPDTTREACPACGRMVRFNKSRQYYYCHTLTGSIERCALSGPGWAQDRNRLRSDRRSFARTAEADSLIVGAVSRRSRGHRRSRRPLSALTECSR